jgi:dTDP-4-dehydrorhamnose reductase
MPTLVDSLADGIIRIVEQNKTGIFHLSGPDQTSVYDFALLAARTFQLDKSLISKVSSDSLNQSGKRPPSTGFVLDKAIDELGFLPVGLSEGLGVVRNLLDNYSISRGMEPN